MSQIRMVRLFLDVNWKIGWLEAHMMMSLVKYGTNSMASPRAHYKNHHSPTPSLRFPQLRASAKAPWTAPVTSSPPLCPTTTTSPRYLSAACSTAPAAPPPYYHQTSTPLPPPSSQTHYRNLRASYSNGSTVSLQLYASTSRPTHDHRPTSPNSSSSCASGTPRSASSSVGLTCTCVSTAACV